MRLSARTLQQFIYNKTSDSRILGPMALPYSRPSRPALEPYLMSNRHVDCAGTAAAPPPCDPSLELPIADRNDRLRRSALRNVLTG